MPSPSIWAKSYLYQNTRADIPVLPKQHVYKHHTTTLLPFSYVHLPWFFFKDWTLNVCDNVPRPQQPTFPPILPEEGIFSIKVRIRKKERMKLSPYLVIWNVDVLVLPLLGFILREKSRSVVVTEQIMPIAPYFENPKLFLSGKNTLW